MKIESANQFKANKESLVKIAGTYGLELKDYDIAATGIENTTIIADCAKGKFVFRIYRKLKKTNEHIHQEINFTEFLHSRGIQVPRIITNNKNELLTMFTDDDSAWQIIVMDFIEGSHPAKYTTGLINTMASLQAKIHTVTKDFKSPYEGFVLKELRERQFIKHIATEDLKDNELIQFIDRAKNFHVELADVLPWGLSHLDFDEGNILVNTNDEITAILDFDDLALVPYVVDLGYSMWSIWYNSDAESARNYLKSYQESRELSTQEMNILPSVILFRHYVICAMFVLEGESDNEHIDKYLSLEKEILTENVTISN
jgi:Ser/Thr protein kinase RdoA (MazF antagonist)